MKFLFYDYNIPQIVNNDKSYGGGSTVQSYTWMRALLNRNHKVGVLVDLDEPNINSEDGLRYVHAFSYKKGIKHLNWVYYRVPFLFKTIKNFKPDVVYQSGAGFITFLLSLICLLLNIKFVHRMANDVDSDERIKIKLRFIESFFYKIGLSLSSLILCQNDYQYNNLIKKYKNQVVRKIHNPYLFNVKIRKLNTIDDRNYIAWLGMFQHQKNLKELLNIVKKFPNVPFKIAGDINTKKLDIETQTALIQLEECTNVNFMGYLTRPEIGEFLSGALCLLNTSRYEGFSNTFLEAFDSGTPVVCLSSVDPDKIIQNNGLGLTSDNYVDLPDIIERVLLMAKSSYNEMSSDCYNYIKKHNAFNLVQDLICLIKTPIKVSHFVILSGIGGVQSTFCEYMDFTQDIDINHKIYTIGSADEEYEILFKTFNIFNPINFFAFIRDFASNNTIVHLYNNLSSIKFSIFLFFLPSRKIVMHERGGIWNIPLSRFRSFALRNTTEKANLIIANSRATKVVLNQRFGVSNNKIQVIYNGINTSKSFFKDKIDREKNS